jgi:hypothetical protein
VIHDDRAQRFQCKSCRHQTSLTAGTVMAATKLPLTTWFLAIYLLSQAKTGLSALALMRQLGVSYPTAWRIHHKLMTAMTEREDRYVLHGSVQIDDAYLGGKRSGGKVGRGSENKVPFVAAVSLTEDAHPLRVKLTPVASDGLACFTAVTTAGCTHEPTVVGGRKPKDLPEFQWINTVLGNLKTSLSGPTMRFASPNMLPATWAPLPTGSTGVSTWPPCPSVCSSLRFTAAPAPSLRCGVRSFRANQIPRSSIPASGHFCSCPGVRQFGVA